MTIPSFNGRRVLVTGANGLLGTSIAEAFFRAGATLVLTDITEMSTELATVVPDAARWSFVRLDLSDAAAIHAWADQLPEAEVPDIVVNNAGIYPFHDILTSEPGQCARIFDVNTLAPLAMMQTFGKRWIALQRKGNVVNVSSASAEVARTNGSVYGASKAALEQLTRIFAIRLGRHGIRVNAVRPGIAQSPLGEPQPAEHLKTIAERIPLGRTLRPEELAEAVLFLAGEQSSFITGQVLSVDGGGSINRRLETTGT